MQTQPASARTGETKMQSNLQNAINKAQRVPCEVRQMGNRQYKVMTPQRHSYTVKFWIHTDGKRYGLCNCQAGSQAVPVPCYHLVHGATEDSFLTQYPAPCARLLAARFQREMQRREVSDAEFTAWRKQILCGQAVYAERLEAQLVA